MEKISAGRIKKKQKEKRKKKKQCVMQGRVKHETKIFCPEVEESSNVHWARRGQGFRGGAGGHRAQIWACQACMLLQRREEMRSTRQWWGGIKWQPRRRHSAIPCLWGIPRMAEQWKCLIKLDAFTELFPSFEIASKHSTKKWTFKFSLWKGLRGLWEKCLN